MKGWVVLRFVLRPSVRLPRPITIQPSISTILADAPAVRFF